MTDPGAPGPQGLAGRFVRGALYMGAANWTTQVFNFGVGILVARMLGPEVFGIYALAVAVNEFISMVNGFGIAPALVQSRDAPQSLMDTGYAMAFGLGVLALGIAGAVAPWVWTSHGAEPAIFLLILALVRIFRLLTDVAGVGLDRSLRYERVAAIHLSAQVLPNIICLVLAWLGFGPWSLVVRDVAVGLTLFGLTRLWSPYRFRGRIERRQFRRITAFAGGLFLGSSLDIFLMRFDRLVVGWLMGTAAIGLYDRARYVAEAGMLATSPVTRVTFNLYARVQDDPARLTRAYVTVNYFLVRLLSAGAVVLVVFPEPTIRLLLGSDWLPAAPILRVLGFYSVLMPLLQNMKVLLVSRARLAANVRVGALQCLVFAPGVVLAARHGQAEGIALALLVSTIGGVLLASLVNREVERGHLLGTYAAPAIAFAATALGFQQLESHFAGIAFWILPFLPALAFALLIAALERGRLLREVHSLRAHLAARAQGVGSGAAAISPK